MNLHLKRFALLSILLSMTLALSGCHRGIQRLMERMHRGELHGHHFGEMEEFGRDLMPFGRGGRGGHRDGEMMQGVSHIFDKTDDGVLYQMIAEDPEDGETIAMIQERLAQMVEGTERQGYGEADEAEDGDESDDADVDDADVDDTSEEEASEEAGDADGAGDTGDADADQDDADADKRGNRKGRHSDGMMGRDFGRGIFGPGMFGRGMRGMDGRGLGAMLEEISIDYSDLEDGGQVTITSENPEAVEMLHAWVDGGPMNRGKWHRDGHGGDHDGDGDGDDQE